MAGRPPEQRSSRLRLALRARAMIAFGATALVLSTSVAGLCFVVTRAVLISQRETAAERQTYLNARAVRSVLDADPDDSTGALAAVQTSSGGSALLRVGGEWYSTSVAVGRGDVPASLREILDDGGAGQQRLVLDGTPVVAGGVALAGSDVAYVELVPMTEVAATLDSVARALLLAAAAMTLIGVGAGRLASGRILRPVRRMSEAAELIREGALDRRLDSDGDGDLEPLVESFNGMVDGLQSRIEREARFASDVSHELRTPLATMDAAVAVARRRATDPGAADALDLLESEVSRFRALVTDLLEISRAEAGIVQLQVEELDPAQLARMVLATSGREHVPLEVDLDEGTRCLADRRRFGQVLFNVLDNADRYAGGATALRVEADDGQVTFHVDDEGPGVPEHERAYVFGRFARGSASALPGAGSGTGLGLALVEEHVRLHRGRVRIDEAPGGGARVSVSLPRAPG